MSTAGLQPPEMVDEGEPFRLLPIVNRFSGLVLVVVGLYVAYYGWFELRLMSGGSPDDPVIAAARRVQGTLAGWVYQHGAWPWLAGLGVVLLAAAAWAWRRRRPVRREPASLDSST